jgi:hypothetical protein
MPPTLGGIIFYDSLVYSCCDFETKIPPHTIARL